MDLEGWAAAGGGQALLDPSLGASQQQGAQEAGEEGHDGAAEAQPDRNSALDACERTGPVVWSWAGAPSSLPRAKGVGRGIVYVICTLVEWEVQSGLLKFR